MEASTCAAIAQARWGARKGTPVGLLHLTTAMSQGDAATAGRLLRALGVWGKGHGLGADDADDILDEVKAGRGHAAATRFLADYDAVEGGKVAPEMGRPPIMEGGKRRNIYLDDTTAEAAKVLGGGNLSEGLRRAVEIAARHRDGE